MIPQSIHNFLNNNTVATLCVAANTGPWCFNCFYILIESDKVLVFKSTIGSRHFEMLEGHPVVAGTVLPNSINFAALQGIQLEGQVLSCNKYFTLKITQLFYDKYPMAADTDGKLFAISLTSLKFTDNCRGFGFKEIWIRHQELDADLK